MFKYVKQLTSLVAMVAVLFTFTTESMAAKKSKTLKNTQKKGFVRCGVSQGLPGFSNADAAGNWTGVDVDVCRAVAAAVLGDANKVKFTPLSAKERFTALTSGEIDILSRNTTWTLSRDADIGLTFVGVNFYDGQGFMVRKSSGITSTSQFKNGISACTNIGTTTELNMRDFFNSRGISYAPVAFEKADEVVAAYGGDRPRYGKNYIIPSTFDPRLISVIPAAVAEAAMKSGAARKKIEDIEAYKDQLTNRLDPSMSIMQGINAKIRKNPKRFVKKITEIYGLESVVKWVGESV